MTKSLKLPRNNSEDIWLVGTGYMSKEYAKVLKHLNKSFNAIGRGEESSNIFFQEIGLNPIKGGLKKALKENACPKEAIVAVSIDQLFECTKELINNGCRRILVEKPAGINLEEIEKLIELESKFNSEVYIAYNRRFFSSVLKLIEKVNEEGGIRSLNFEFTELGYKIRNNKKFNKEVLEKWLIANSSHVIDLVFFLIGTPKENSFSAFHSGESDWHKPTKFNGAGLSIMNIPFSYHADWEAPGRWGVEVLTKYNKYILRPIEELWYIKIGEFKSNKINLDTEEKNYKSGLLEQCKAFFFKKRDNLCTLEKHHKNFKYYLQIADY